MATKGRWARSLASTGAALAVLGWAHDPAIAANPGTSCCADLEERIAELEATTARKRRDEKTELKIGGVVHRGLFYWDDGVERNLYSVDPSKDATTLFIDGQTDLAPGLKVGFTLNTDVNFSISETTNQLTSFGDGGTILPADVYVFAASEKLGTVRVGFQASASDSIENINLADADVVADYAILDWNGSFFLRAKGGGLSKSENLLTDIAYDNLFPIVVGNSANLVTYTSPEIMGFELMAAWGMDDLKDVALRYNGVWADAFEVKAGIGYYDFTTEGHAPDPLTGLLVIEPTLEETGWGGSFAVRHKATGLNLAVNYSTLGFIDKCVNPGAVTGKCRGDDETLYVIGGIVRNIIPLGATSFYGEYFRGTRKHNESDDVIMSAVLADPEGFDLANPTEMKESVMTAWGFGVVQKFNDDRDPAGKKGVSAAKDVVAKEAVMEVYVSYRHFDEPEIDLIGRTEIGNIVAAPAKKLEDFDLIGTGAVIRF
jgi:hypothetical protein